MRTLAAIGLLVAAVASLSAQEASNTSGAQPVFSEAPRVYRTTGARIAIARDIHVPEDEEVSDTVVVVGGSARIDGRVRDGVVVVGGNLDFGARSDVRGDIVVVGGRVHREPGAMVRGRVSDVSIGDWSSWTLGGLSLPVVQFGGFGHWLSLFGTVFRVGFLALAMGIIILVARAPVARIGRSAAAEPARAFVVGLAAEIFFIPVLIIAAGSLIITIIGIPVALLLIPAAILTAFVALLLGFTALTCRIGEWVEDRMRWRASSAILAMTIGLVLIVAPTLIARLVGIAPAPLRWSGFGLLAVGITIEFIVWTIGLGATLLTGFGRWSTAPPPAPPAVPDAAALPAIN